VPLNFLMRAIGVSCYLF